MLKRTRYFLGVAALALLVMAMASPKPLRADDKAVAGSDQLALSATPVTVVELFTSQGCSTCPPADKLLGELAQREDVVALSVHVDYWDYIGWKDEFASPENTARQREYARRLRLRYVYTPQMVIQGVLQAPGTHREHVMAAIKDSKKMERVAVSLKRGDKGVDVLLPEQGGIRGDVQVLVAGYDFKHTADIARGENAGRELAYFNVLKKLERVGIWRGNDRTISVPWQAGWGDGVAVILQSQGTGRILGAAKLPLPQG